MTHSKETPKKQCPTAILRGLLCGSYFRNILMRSSLFLLMETKSKNQDFVRPQEVYLFCPRRGVPKEIESLDGYAE